MTSPSPRRRRSFPFAPAALGVAASLLAVSPAAGEPPGPNVRAEVPARLNPIAKDHRITLTLHAPAVVMDNGGWQPFLFCSAHGTLFCQAQLHAKPFNSKGKMVYHLRIGTAVSRDGGATWTRWTHQENHDDVNIEGGAVQCADANVLMLDTFVMPTSRPDHGMGELWRSHDDLRSLDGPAYVDVYLPGINWTGSTDDRGKPHDVARLHRSIVELPGGDLLTTMYTWFRDDRAPSPYMPTMMKTRTVVIRSRDHGASWAYLATVAVDGAVGTEGFAEPVLVRISRGAHAGRLVCLMRTGRELYQAHSDDAGRTWSHPAAAQFPGINIYDTARWVGLFENPDAPGYVPSDQMYGVEVDPDLIEMRDGTLVCTVGVRTPEKKCFQCWNSPVNGDYLAFSCDGGDTWTEVEQFLSGQPTTQYMGIREIAPGVLFVVYDDSIWKPAGRTMGFRLDVSRRD
jgi:hypothetical protein